MIDTKWMDGMKDGMKPLADLMTISTQAMETLVKHHMEAASAVFESGLSHVRSIGGTKDVAAFAQAQSGYMMSIGKSLVEVVQKDLETLAGAQTALTKLMDGAVKEGVTKARRAASEAA